MELKNKKIVFLGDSITEGVGASSYENCYVARFAAMTGAEVVNYGIGGTRFARRRVPHENPRFDQDFCGRYEKMDDDADIVVVFGGTNDYGHGDAPLGQMGDRSVWSFYGACHTLFSGLIAKYPDKTIIVMTPMHRTSELDKDPPAAGLCVCRAGGGGVLLYPRAGSVEQAGHLRKSAGAEGTVFQGSCASQRCRS